MKKMSIVALGFLLMVSCTWLETVFKPKGPPGTGDCVTHGKITVNGGAPPAGEMINCDPPNANVPHAGGNYECPAVQEGTAVKIKRASGGCNHTCPVCQGDEETCDYNYNS